jgi:uncharacterized protein
MLQSPKSPTHAKAFLVNSSSEILRPAGIVRFNIFLGPNGLRAGWRLLIFFAILLPVGYGTFRLIDAALNLLHLDNASPSGSVISTGTTAFALLLVSWIMTRIEGRSISAYGVPWRRAFCLQFWQGAAISLVSLTALLFVLHLAGALSFGSLALHGVDIWKYGTSWAVVFFLLAFIEDFLYRGYLLFTLTTGIGFYAAAIVSSLWMGGMHYLNPGGHGLGPVITTVYCLVTCLVIRRTGDLWMPFGIHAAWDWGITFVYGVPSGGQLTQQHLLSAQLHGPAWLTGGTYGPEASWPNLALLVIWGCFFSVWLRGVKYPNLAAGSAAILDPRSKRKR